VRSLIAQYFLNHRLDMDEIRRQMEQLALAGYHGVYAHARPGMLTPYMSAEWWEAIDVMLDCCRRLGLEFWIWDEDYFPSGLCGGRVVWSDPGLAARQLEFALASVDGSRPVEVDFAPGLLLRAYAIEQSPDGSYGEWHDVTEFCGTRRQRWTSRYQLHRAYSPMIHNVSHPHWRTEMQDNRFALVWTPPRPGRYLISAALVQNLPTTHPDLLRPEGVRLFLELSHEQYARRYEMELGGLIKGAFTDEPSPGAWVFPWTAQFPEQFREDHGYDILDFLPHLATDLDECSAVVRHHYRLTQHRLQKEHYLGQIGDWCAEHGLAFTGHLTRTEWLSLVSVWWPNELRCYEAMDIPCCDPLGASEGFPDAASYHTGLKVASSAAHLFGKPQAGCDCVAVIGDEASLADLKYHFDYQMVLGINHFTVHGLSYSNDGPRKDEVPPSIFYQHTQWHHMSTLLGHVEKVCEALTGGTHLCETAVLYPSTSLACQVQPGRDWMCLEDEGLIHQLSEQLLSRQRDFDFIDEVALEKVAADGALQTPEPYRVVLLPWLRYIGAGAAEGLRRFAAAGGRVVAVGRLPRAIGADPLQAPEEWGEGIVELWPEVTEDRLRSLQGVEVSGDGARDVFVLQRECGGQERTFAFNRREGWFEGEVAGRAVCLPPRGSALFSGSEVLAGSVVPLPHDAVELRDGWTLEFAQNHVPLSFWHVTGPDVPDSDTFVSGQGYDLMRREDDPAGDGEDARCYWCRFMLTGDMPDARLVIEDSSFSGDWTLLVNGQAVGDWSAAREFDCLNKETAIGALLRTGSTPTLNVLCLRTSGPGRGLHEMPYLYGSFGCEYRYGHLSLPFLRGGSGKLALDALQSWGALGYPTYSGSATYRCRVSLQEGGDYVLDLGRVEDCAAVSLDGEQVAVLPWPPYRCALSAMAPGGYELAVEVCNPPANRNRAAGLVAGLLGPVRVGR